MKRIERYTNIAKVVTEELVRRALLAPESEFTVNFQPELAAVVARSASELAVVNRTTGEVKYYEDAESAAEALLAAWVQTYEDNMNSRSALEKLMRDTSHKFGVGGRGGSRPATREDDARREYAQPPGKLGELFQFKPFASDRGDTFSTATMEVTRCNYCGAWGVRPYAEVTHDLDSGEYVARFTHDGDPLEHRSYCKLVQG